MYSKFIKYCNIKAVTVFTLLFAFTFVSFGQDIHNCLCKPEKPKVEKKMSCCSKEEGKKKSETKDDGCCSKKKSSSCDDCKTCSFEKKVQKEQGAINESKITKTEVKVIVAETLSPINNNYTHKTFLTGQSPGTRTKVFLEVSNLRI